MKTLVVYESQYGNTEQIARAIADTLGARVIPVADAGGVDLSGVELLLIGGPTQGHGAPRQLRAWVEELAAAPPAGLAVATFDTRLRWPVFLAGSAARTLATLLQRPGVRRAAAPESFLVLGREGPLADGELERAASWAARFIPAPAGRR